MHGCYSDSRIRVLSLPSVAHPRAAGATWSCLTTNAPWASRNGHTSVIDGGGAIYVIGGFNIDDGIYLGAVWVSRDGGADRTRAGTQKVRRVLEGYGW